MEADETCIVCSENLEATRARPESCVNHFFHPDCLRKMTMIKYGDSPKCPCCQVEYWQIAIETPGERQRLEDYDKMSENLETVCFKCLVRDDVPLIVCRKSCKYKYHDNCLLSDERLNTDGSKMCDKCHSFELITFLSLQLHQKNFETAYLEEFLKAEAERQYNRAPVLRERPTPTVARRPNGVRR